METPSSGIIDTGRHACTIGLKSLFKAINDRSPASREARKFFERTKTAVQCKNVMSVKTHCWLCGNAFTPRDTPQCEHVLPVAQGVIFLQLYSSKAGSVTDAMKLEYEWAHPICNNLKNAIVLIKGEESHFDPDIDKIVQLLRSIQSRGIPVAEDQISHVQRRLFEVTNYINALPDYNINAIGETCARKLTFKGGRKTFRRKHNGRIVHNVTIGTNVSASRSHRKVRTTNSKRA